MPETTTKLEGTRALESDGGVSKNGLALGSSENSPGLAQIMEEYRGRPMEEVVKELNKVPFFMTDPEEAENTPEMEALRALAYDGTPEEVAENFKTQGNECFAAKKYKDAIEFYRRSLEVEGEVPSSIRIASLGNRAQCQLILRNYRSAISDCNAVLKIDPTNSKAWFRSARAFLALNRPEETITCAELGLRDCLSGPSHDELERILAEGRACVELMRKRDAERLARKDLAENRANTLKLALGARGITRFFSEQDDDRRHSVGDLQPALIDPLDATSELTIPVLLLYPLKMQSDIIDKVSEHQTLAELVSQAFESPPAWADGDYTPDNLSLYIQTATGGLAAAGLNSSLLKVLSCKKPDIILIDNFARFFVVPKNKAKEWLSTWDKRQALAQLQQCKAL